MSFLAPLFLVGAAAAAIPIVLHLLKREPEVHVKFSAVKLLREAPVEHAQKRHLRELLLLALRVAALLLLAFAFARPFLTASAAAGASGVTVVALDTSLSMSAPGQFEKAQRLARQAIDNARGGTTSVITFADTAAVVSPPSGDSAAARAAVDRARPGVSSTSYRGALNAAASLMNGRRGTIVIVTDLQANGWDAGDRVSLPASVAIQIADVGAPPENLAVTAARIVDDRVVATVRNTGSEARQAHVVLNVQVAGDNSATTTKSAETTIPVGAQESADASFPVPAGRWASVTVDDAKGVAADNARYLVLDANARPAILIVTEKGDLSREGFYVNQALLASAVDSHGYDVEGVSGADLQKWDDARFDAHSAVILLSTRGLDHHGRSLVADYVKKGGGVLVAAGAGIEGEVIQEALGDSKVSMVPPAAGAGAPVRTLAPADVRHPVFRALGGRSSLGLVKFKQIAQVRATECPTLAQFTTGEPALVDCDVAAGRAIVFASDLDNKWNDFPLHATFVPFVHEAIRYLSSGRRSSDYVIAQVPAGVPRVPGVAPFTPVEGAASQLVAVNVDPAESDPSRLTADEFQTAVNRLQEGAVGDDHVEARQREEGQHLWQYVLGLMIAMLIVESAVAMRTA
jgi:aerotolerance regulator-like protein/VWA domain-containing protein